MLKIIVFLLANVLALQSVFAGSFVEIIGESEKEVRVARHRYQNDNGVVVELWPSVHAAELNFFEELNRRAQNWDGKILYERAGGPVTESILHGEVLQNFFKYDSQFKREMSLYKLPKSVAIDAFISGLTFQSILFFDPMWLNTEKFVHADLDESDAAETAILKDCEAHVPLDESLMNALLQFQGRDTLDVDFCRYLRDQQVLIQLSMMMGRGVDIKDQIIQQIQYSPLAPQDDAYHSIVTARHEKLKRVLDSQLQNGCTKIAIVYGADHFSGDDGIEAYLLSLGFEQCEVEWHRVFRKS